jgi:hypothetical protein
MLPKTILHDSHARQTSRYSSAGEAGPRPACETAALRALGDVAVWMLKAM